MARCWAGTSPTGAVYLIRDGKTLARVGLPVDSIFDVLLLPEVPPGAAAHAPTGPTFLVALVATGNPGRIYRVALDQFRPPRESTRADSPIRRRSPPGVSPSFGEMRDRNVRRLALLPDGRIAAGSAPHGNVYLFPRNGGHPSCFRKTMKPRSPTCCLSRTAIFTPRLFIRHRRVNTASTGPVVPEPPLRSPPAQRPPRIRETTPPPASRQRRTQRGSLRRPQLRGFLSRRRIPRSMLLTRSSLAFYRSSVAGVPCCSSRQATRGRASAWDLKPASALRLPG